MTQKEVYQDIENYFGLVPTFWKKVPEATLDAEWDIMKKLAVEESVIPNKYRELIGLALTGFMKCKYCTFYHTEVAKLFGATDEEIEEAVHLAKLIAGWSTYVNGMQVDFEQFKKEITAACDYAREMMAAQSQDN